MQESEESTGSDKVLILPLNEGSKRITQILSNDRAMKVLEILADEPMSATDLAERMETPLTTIKYNIDALVEADLIKVKQTKWSRKGREIKIYEPVQKIIVVAPGGMKEDKASILRMLRKYLVMVGGAVFAATGLEALTNYMSFGPAPMGGSVRSSEYQDAASLNSEDLPADASERSSTPEAPMEEKATSASDEAADYDVTGEELPEAGTFEEPLMEQSVEGQDQITEPPQTGDMSVPKDIDTDTVSSLIPNDSLDNGANIMIDGFNSSATGQTPMPGGSQMVTENVPMLSQPVSGLIPHDILSHASVWFFFGCLFVIALLFIREIYYRKKEI
ncbi:MAG: helix-turn-helix transcriptional regulator [Methanosarcinaceae archaeon]|nr:helix-turn-helix transcriptional regulator [Methanosarcinaceae archaeon]